MSTITVSDIPLTAGSPAERLRRLAAAVRVHFTWWGVHRTLSAQQKEELGDAYSADSRFLTAGKKLIDVKHEAYRKLTSLRSRVASYWRGLTLPYVEPGIRLIRQADIEGFVQAMEGFHAELKEAEAELDAVYGPIKADAHRRLGRLYNPDDYPPELAGLFNVEWDFPSTEPPSYLRQLHPDIYQQEQERVSRRFEEAVQLAEQAFISEFGKLVAHLTERLSNDGQGACKIFRDSVITNLVDFFDRFKQLNVRSNGQLDDLVAQAQRIVRGVRPQELRDNDALRQQVAAQFSHVSNVLDTLMVDRPRRRIIRATPSTNGVSHAVAD